MALGTMIVPVQAEEATGKVFQVNGPVGLANWKDYCYDLKDSDVAKQPDK